MTVKEYYHECLLQEEAILAHYIFYLLSEHIISLQDDYAKLDLNKADHEKVKELIDKNILGIRRVNVYSLKRNARDFTFIFARSEQDAIQFYVKIYGETPMNCQPYSLENEVMRGKEAISFRKMRKEHKSFPAVAGSYRKGL